MTKYQVTITNKKDNSIAATTIIESENNIGICLKGRMALISEIRFDKRKHSIEFMEI